MDERQSADAELAEYARPEAGAMTEALLVSNVLLWIAVLALGAVVLALVRQIGVLHERVTPVGALMTRQGPAIGEAVPELTLKDFEEREVRVGGTDPEGRRTLLFFLSPTCPVCESLLPTVLRVARDEKPQARVVLASDGDPDEHREFARQHDLGGHPYILSSSLGMTYQVAKLPYAVLIDADGVLRAKGLVNTREHVESLFEAERLGVASIQEYLEKSDAQLPSTTNGGAS
jgi:methylamine dehydrogenase accessory protein MauD